MHPSLCAALLPWCTAKRDNIGRPDRAVDNPSFVPELSPELSFDRVRQICQRRFSYKEIQCLIFRQIVDFLYESMTCKFPTQ